MASDHSDPAPIDPRLIEKFALFREELPGADGPLEDWETKALERLSEFRSEYAFTKAVKVVLEGGITFLVVPGADGIQMLPPFDARGLFSANGGLTGQLLKGLPVGSSGPLVYGLAADGVQLQSVALADRTTVKVPVKRNVYAVQDPTRSSPQNPRDR
jgi:hypothetical protein